MDKILKEYNLDHLSIVDKESVSKLIQHFIHSGYFFVEGKVEDGIAVGITTENILKTIKRHEKDTK